MYGDGKYFSYNESESTISDIERVDWPDTVFIHARMLRKEAGSHIAGIDPISDDYSDKTVYKCNILEYIRTITTFGTELTTEYKPSTKGDGIVVNPSHVVSSDSTGDNINVLNASPEFYGYAILYILLVAETLIFFYTYLKRIFKLAFYTMIAPLIAFMYPIDKLGDGKAQAFNTWFKEYLYNVLIQPLHLLLYTIFIYAAMDLMHESIIYALGAYAYMIAAEKFFKKIFGFDKAPSGGPSGLASGMAGAAAMKGLSGLKGSNSKKSGKNKENDTAHKKIKYAKNSQPTTPTGAVRAGNGGIGTGTGGTGTGGTGTGGTGIPGSAGGINNPATSGSLSAPGSIGSSRGRMKGIGSGIGHALGDRGTRLLTAGKASNMSELSWGNVIRGAGSRVGRGLKYGGKKASQITGGLLGIAGGIAAGATVGMVASALSGEDKMADAMQTGALGGVAFGSSLGGRAYDWTGEKISGIWNDSKVWAASQNGGNNVELAAQMQMETFAEKNQEFFDSMTSEQKDEIIDGFRCGAKIKDQSDAEQYLAARKAGIDAFTAAEMSSTDDEMSPYGETFRDFVRSNTSISEASDAQRAAALDEARRVRQKQIDVQKEHIRKMQRDQLEEMANANRAHADVNRVRSRQTDEMNKANRELRRLEASQYSNEDYEKILLESIQNSKIERQQKFHEKNW